MTDSLRLPIVRPHPWHRCAYGTAAQPCARNGCIRWAATLLLLAAWLALTPAVYAQTPGPGAAPGAQAPAPGTAPAPGAAAAAAPAGQVAAAPAGGVGLGPVHFRVYLPMIDQLSYTLHPFYQITGDSSYIGATAPTSIFLRFRYRLTDTYQNRMVRFIHALPSLGVEWTMATGIPFPRGMGLGVDYMPISQHDTDAATSGTVAPIAMDAYYYTGVLRLYFFDPGQPGFNYFVGFGLGFITGSIRAIVGDSYQFSSFSQPSVGSTRFGLETRGDNWGFRYELSILNANKVNLKSNPYQPDQTQLDFSGSMMRVALFYQF